LHSVATAVKRLFGRGRSAEREEEPAQFESAQQSPRQATTTNHATRSVHLESDIPLDVIEQTYVPHQASSKTSFRSDGSDHQRDQEFIYGVEEERWNAEDRFTNKSGDPRIGTHRRTYEPGESREESRE
jgi:hypothetical protein